MSAFLDGLLLFLFKYRPAVWAQGHLTLLAGPLVAAAALAVGVAALIAWRAYRGTTAAPSPFSNRLLTGLRGAALLLLFFCLLRPALVISRVVPRQNVLGVLLDDSRSMRLADQAGRPRSEWAAGAFGEEGTLTTALEESFLLRFFRFDRTAARVSGPASLTADGSRTDLAASLERVRRDLAGLPLAGLVLVTDGADNGSTPLTDVLVALRGASVPVYTVGVGQPRLEADVEIGRIEVPTRILAGSSVTAEVMVQQQGFAGQAAVLTVEADTRMVERRTITLPEEGRTLAVPVSFSADRAGPVRYRFAVTPMPAERITQNNERVVLVEVEDARRRILYFEGEPRFELKFVRWAIEQDPNLQLVALEQTAENKYLRLGIDDPADLADGFPDTREELYTYEGLILGSVPADYFTPDQLQLIADFVSRRGGGLIVLGGRRGLAEGGFAGTPLAELLPLELPAAPAPVEAAATEVKAVVTPAGLVHAVTRLEPDEAANREHWERLPALTVVNALGPPKPGATVLLEGARTDGGPDIPLLLFQRYGRGRVMLVAAQDTWLWQMHAGITVEDATHETLWRQLLRWLVNEAPDRVRVVELPGGAIPGQEAALAAEVTDRRFLGLNDMRVQAFLTGPDSTVTALPMTWDPRQDGRYTTLLVPAVEGLHQVNIEAAGDSQFVGSAAAWFWVGEGDEEYFGAAMRAPLLERIARETGGRFYTPDQARHLPDDVPFTRAGVTVRDTLELWDMPILLLALLTLVGAEWLLRRRRGLA